MHITTVQIAVHAKKSRYTGRFAPCAAQNMPPPNRARAWYNGAMRKFFLIAFAFFMIFFSPAAEIIGRVVRVADGDTITVLDGSNIQHRVRLAKIDAPEKAQPFGTVSRAHLAGMVTNGTVRVTFTARDRYGRIIGTVFAADGTETNLRMIADGFAWHYTAFDSSPEYAAAECAARKDQCGLWRDPNPVPPWNWRKAKRAPGKGK